MLAVLVLGGIALFGGDDDDKKDDINTSDTTAPDEPPEDEPPDEETTTTEGGEEPAPIVDELTEVDLENPESVAAAIRTIVRCDEGTFLIAKDSIEMYQSSCSDGSVDFAPTTELISEDDEAAEVEVSVEGEGTHRVKLVYEDHWKASEWQQPDGSYWFQPR